MNYCKVYIFIIAILLLVSNVSAEFEDDFQDHPSNDLRLGPIDKQWYPLSTNPTICTIGTHSTYPYVKYAYVSTTTGIYRSMSSVDPDGSEYFSYVLYGTDKNTGADSYLRLYGKNGNLLFSYAMPTSTTLGFHEYVISGSDIYKYINGNLVGDIGDIYETPYYYAFDTTTSVTGAGNYRYHKIDSFSIDGFVIGIGTEESPDTWINTASNNEIDVEWTVNTIDPYADWDDSTYQMRVTWLDTGAIVNTTTLDKTKPNGFVIYNRSTLMPVPNYGVYRFDLLKDSVLMESDYLTFLPIGSSGTLDWDQVDYVPYQNATITYTVSPFTPADYNYYIRTYEINIGLIDTNTLTANSGTLTESLDDWEIGSYYSLLVVVDKSDSSEYTVAFDVFDINDEVYFEGYTYDALVGTVLDTTFVNFTQSSTWYNTTSNATAFYELSGMSDSVQITLNASKTNYTHSDFEFTPPTSKLYTANLYLFPTNLSNITNSTSTIEGMVVDYPLHQAVGSSSVYFSNATWSKTITTNSFGYYNLSGLAPGTYSMIASNPSYDNSTTYSVTTTANNTTIQNLVLQVNYLLTVKATDSESGAYISTFTATVNNTEVSTTTGTALFNLSWNLYTVSITAEDYYPGSQNVLLNQNRTVTIPLTRTESVYYQPHYVKFIVQNLWGSIKYQDVLATVYNGSSTTSSFTGTTDSFGSVTFKLTETNKYRITFINATQGVSESLTVYPKEDRYYVIVSSTNPWTDYGEQLNDVITFNVSKETINSTHAFINVSYTDTSGNSNNIDVWLNRSTPSDVLNQTLVDSNTGETATFTHSFTVSNYADQTYFVRFDVDHADYGTFIRDYSVYFESDVKVTQLPDSIYLYLAVILMMFTGALFTKTSAEVGALIVCSEGWIFKAWGWFDEITNQNGFVAALVLATVISLIAIWNAKSKEENID